MLPRCLCSGLLVGSSVCPPSDTYHRLLIKKVCSHFVSLEKNENNDSIYLSSLSISFLLLGLLGVLGLEGIAWVVRF